MEERVPKLKLKSILDLLLVLLYAPSKKGYKEPITGITRLEKLMFLFSKFSNTKIEDLKFEKYYYGPYSEAIYDVVQLAAENNLITLVEARNLPEYDLEVTHAEWGQKREYFFKLTKDGEKIAKILWENLSDEDKFLVLELKRRFNRVPLRSLISLIYVKYPEYLEYSKLKNKISLFGIAPDLPSFSRRDVWCHE